jgi:hypothetical protein
MVFRNEPITAHSPSAPVALQVTVAVEATALALQLSLQNRLDGEIYVEQYLPSETAAPQRGGYVYLHQDGRLLLYFGTVPNPSLLPGGPRGTIARPPSNVAWPDTSRPATTA